MDGQDAHPTIRLTLCGTGRKACLWEWCALSGASHYCKYIVQNWDNLQNLDSWRRESGSQRVSEYPNGKIFLLPSSFFLLPSSFGLTSVTSVTSVTKSAAELPSSFNNWTNDYYLVDAATASQPRLSAWGEVWQLLAARVPNGGFELGRSTNRESIDLLKLGVGFAD